MGWGSGGWVFRCGVGAGMGGGGRWVKMGWVFF